MAAFLGALHNSGRYKPSIVVCPATMLRTWHRELLCATTRQDTQIPSYPVNHQNLAAVMRACHCISLRCPIIENLENIISAPQRRIWAPGLEPRILHDSFVRKGTTGGGGGGSSRAKRSQLIAGVKNSEEGVVITTYSHLRLFKARGILRLLFHGFTVSSPRISLGISEDRVHGCVLKHSPLSKSQKIRKPNRMRSCRCRGGLRFLTRATWSGTRTPR